MVDSVNKVIISDVDFAFRARENGSKIGARNNDSSFLEMISGYFSNDDNGANYL